jgi:hypothetical protein
MAWNNSHLLDNVAAADVDITKKASSHGPKGVLMYLPGLPDIKLLTTFSRQDLERRSYAALEELH